GAFDHRGGHPLWFFAPFVLSSPGRFPGGGIGSSDSPQARPQEGAQAHGGGSPVRSRNPSARSLPADGRLGEPDPGAFPSGCSRANPRAGLGAQSKKTTEATMSWAASSNATTTCLLITGLTGQSFEYTSKSKGE